MSDFKLLVVDDDSGVLESVKTSIQTYKGKKGKNIQCETSSSFDEALKKLDSTFDGALIDLRLDHTKVDDNKGDQLFDIIHNKYRIPAAIMTGTPSQADSTNELYMDLYVKGVTSYEQIFDDFFKVYDTGLTKILGGRGLIEDELNKVFWNSIIPRLKSWKAYVVSGKNTEKALLRFTLNHLLESLDHDSESCFPEEMYISGVNATLKTGTIVKIKEKPGFYIVLSPACDLACHDGVLKTDAILVCEIQKLDASWKNMDLDKLTKNNLQFYYHILPKTSKFEGGLINFRKITTYSRDEVRTSFEYPDIKIASSFVKDVVSRFSSYYARQGQPNFDFETLKKELKEYLG